LPATTRLHVAIWLNLAWVCHYCSLAMHIVYWGYIRTQTMPGALAANLPFVISIVSPIVAAVVQGKAEAAVIAQYPMRFPPTFGSYCKTAWADYQADLKANGAEPGWCYAGFFGYLRREARRMREDTAEYAKICGFETATMSGVVATRNEAADRLSAKARESRSVSSGSPTLRPSSSAAVTPREVLISPLVERSV